MDGEEFALLVRRARTGDRDARDEICRRYGPCVRAAIHGRLGRDLRARVDTEDVFQSAILASLDDLSDLRSDDEEGLLAWLEQVAERRFLVAVRRHRAQARDVQREVPLDAAAELPAPLTSPAQSAERDETTAAVRDAVVRLPEIERRVVELRSYEGLGYLEIARRLGLADRHAARNAYVRALRRMGDQIAAKPRRPAT